MSRAKGRPMTGVAELRTDMHLLDKSKRVVTPTRARDFHKADVGGGGGKVIAIRDSGIDDTHPIFDGVTVKKPDIDGLPTNGKDEVGHGTMTAGLTILPLDSVEKIISVPIFGKSGRTGLDTIRRSYEYLTNHADEIDYVNDSWGARRKISQIDQWHNEMEQAGIDSVVASGNTDQQTGSPATASRAFAIAGCTLDGRMTRFSSPTDDVTSLALNVAAPKSKDANMGEPVPDDAYGPVMETIGGKWNYAPGTSFAAPRALGLGVNYQTTQVESTESTQVDETRAFEAAFTNTATDIKGTGEDGQGYINYERAVERGVKQPPEQEVSVTIWGDNIPFLNDSYDFMQIPRDVFENGDYTATVADLKDAIGGE